MFVVAVQFKLKEGAYAAFRQIVIKNARASVKDRTVGSLMCPSRPIGRSAFSMRSIPTVPHGMLNTTAPSISRPSPLRIYPSLCPNNSTCTNETTARPYESLVRAIAHQQLHGKAADIAVKLTYPMGKGMKPYESMPISRSVAAKNAIETYPLSVKNAMLRRLRSPGRTMLCSQIKMPPMRPTPAR